MKIMPNTSKLVNNNIDEATKIVTTDGQIGVKLLNPALSEEEKRKHSLAWVRAMAPPKEEALKPTVEPVEDDKKGQRKSYRDAVKQPAAAKPAKAAANNQPKAKKGKGNRNARSRSNSPKPKSPRSTSPKPSGSKDFQRGRPSDKGNAKTKGRHRSTSPFENRRSRRSPSPKPNTNNMNPVEFMEFMLAQFKNQNKPAKQKK